MKKFDTKVQHLKYFVLREVARSEWKDSLLDDMLDIPKKIIPDKKPTMRCCTFKEKEIINQQIKLAIGGDKTNPNVIEVIEDACDECPVGGYEVTGACRGCLAHRCFDACKFNAIVFDKNHVAHIDKSKCKECGACAKVCPYSAIINLQRPCEQACKVKAISMDESKRAKIDNDKCISCGACVYQCPWGAIMDKSFILNAIDIIKRSQNNQAYKVYAVVAPSISSQFSYASLGQVVSGIKKLGFHTVIEAALGADVVAFYEALELYEKKFLTSSCCPAFVDYIHKEFPDLVKYISHNPSPMVAMGKIIKEKDKSAKVIFIGPCTAKKMEFQKPEANKYVDCVLTFEELQALFDSKDIELEKLSEDVLDNASYFGRIFARSGGLTDAVVQAFVEHKITDFEPKAEVCDGIEQCKVALLKLSKGIKNADFIEGMACVGGCIGGAGCLTHGAKNRTEIDKYGKEALEKTISDAIRVLQL